MLFICTYYDDVAATASACTAASRNELVQMHALEQQYLMVSI